MFGPMVHSLWMASAVFDGARAFGRLAPDLGRHCERVIESANSFGMTADIDPPLEIGSRRIYNVTGGTFVGPKLRGVVLPGGGDWLRRRADGVSELDVRATLKTDDDELIYVYYRGIVATSSGGLYFRTTPVFETGSEKYAWLNNIISVGVNRPAEQGKVSYDIYEIL